MALKAWFKPPLSKFTLMVFFFVCSAFSVFYTIGCIATCSATFDKILVSMFVVISAPAALILKFPGVFGESTLPLSLLLTPVYWYFLASLIVWLFSQRKKSN